MILGCWGIIIGVEEWVVRPDWVGDGWRGGRFGERPGTCLGRVWVGRGTGARCPSIVKVPQDEPKFMRKWAQATYQRLSWYRYYGSLLGLCEANVLKDFGLLGNIKSSSS